MFRFDRSGAIFEICGDRGVEIEFEVVGSGSEDGLAGGGEEG